MSLSSGDNLLKKRESMSNNTSGKTEWIKIILFIVGEAFTIFSFFRMLADGVMTKAILAGLTTLLLILPLLIEKLSKKKLSLPVYILCIIYAVCPMLGHSYGLYYIWSWWDELLHFTGGIVFALAGFEIAYKMDRSGKTSNNLMLAAFFGLFFSVTLSVFWEFAEYGCDLFFGMDMQSDTVVNSITSYTLSSEAGITNGIDSIEEVIINGQSLEVSGYLDIGLHDTMTDLLTESFGAVIAMIIFVVTKGRFRLFRKEMANT